MTSVDTLHGDAGRAASLADALRHHGLRWRASGNSVLSGPLYRLATACDNAFSTLAAQWSAEPEQHPAMIELTGLQAVDYLSSFPHLATFPVSLDADEANLREFAGRTSLDGEGSVRLGEVAPVREVLTPAACYHLYLHHQGEALDGPLRLTTRNTCFRREAHYEPLRRQWSFQMREIVCLGARDEVIDFLATTRRAVDVLLSELDLPVAWEVATDPFFQPTKNPKYLAQRLQPTKHEAVFGGDLAVASVNLHEDHFGAAYGITRAGRPAVSGCVAFGVERWLHAVADRHGPDPAGWPDVEAAARRAAAVISPNDDREGAS
ncbi:MAG: aminoacyl--tRNA ligase-related protein [Stackebrandtia sp.]